MLEHFCDLVQDPPLSARPRASRRLRKARQKHHARGKLTARERLEAMNTEVAINAPHAGTVVSVAAAAGDQVSLGSVLFEVATEED